MDYRLRQLKRNAIKDNSLQSWQAYAYALERVEGEPGPVKRSIVCYNIDWDVDDGSGMGDYGLPPAVVFHSDSFDLDSDLSEDLANELSDQFGFTLNSFDYTVTDCIDTDL